MQLQILHCRIMQLQILQMQKIQKLFCINTKNNAKTHARAKEQKTGENQRKNGKNATTSSEANNEQIRIDDINLHRNLLLYIYLVQVYNLQCKKCKCRFCIVLYCRVMQMQILQPVCTMYMNLYLYMYLFKKSSA